jgi:hypothetical protein
MLGLSGNITNACVSLIPVAGFRVQRGPVDFASLV